tara:strand:- start:3810 stop:4535 length:726 start_codon:yes stop_codon:yes gene_type:complete
MNKRYTHQEVLEKFGNSENELVQIATKYNSTKITDPECVQYCHFYDRHLSHLRDKAVKILEIGVKDGDSLKMWKDYFRQGEVCGLEFNPEPLKGFSEDRVKVYIGDQTDLSLLEKISEESGPFDIILDDASHVVDHQIISFEYLFKNSLKEGGLYIVEDLGTSYWPKWGGALRKPTTAIEYLKSLVDNINFRFHKGDRTQYVGIPEDSKIDASYYDRNVVGLSFYKGCCIVEKGDNPLKVE